MKLIARVPGIVMYGDRFRGEGFHITDWDGWVGSADIVRDSIKRPNTHGRFPAKQYLDAREVPAAGFLVAKSFDDRLLQLQRLTSLVLLDSFPLAVELDGVQTWGFAHLAEYPRVDAAGFVPEAKWSATFVLDDPLVYGSSRRFPLTGSSMAVAAYHYGSAPAWPLLNVVTSSSTGYVIRSGSSEFHVAASVPGAQDHIDMRTGRLYRNGVLQPSGSLRRDTWSIPPGKMITQTLTPNSGTATFTVDATDTWG